MPKTTKIMNSKVNEILAASGGAFAGGAAMKLTKKADGTTNPIAAIGSAVIGGYLVLKGKNNTMKALGLGLAAVGIVGTLGKVAEKVPMMSKITPSINGIGELYEDEDGNLVELGSLAGSPQMVQDQNGNTYMIEGLAGDEYEEEYEDYEISGLSGDDDLMAA